MYLYTKENNKNEETAKGIKKYVIKNNLENHDYPVLMIEDIFMIMAKQVMHH